MTTNVNPNSRVALTLFSAAALFGSLSLSSCQDYEPFSETEVRAAMTAREYAANFIGRYGEPDPNHTWGFGETPFMNIAVETRAGGNGTGETVDTHTNMWIDWDDNNNSYKDHALALNIYVPGWPNVDGHYYTSNSSNCDLEDIKSSQPKNSNNYQPAGDVTEYEVRYVSDWFRNNPNPKREELHLSDFFVQNISVDYDRMSYPDGDIITTSQQAYDGNKTTITGTADENLDFALDWLHFMPMGADPNEKETWTHINNFNRGNSNISPKPLSSIDTDGQSNYHREIKYVYSSGTEDFACRPSFATSENNSVPIPGEFIDSWTLVKLEWDEPMADGETHHRVGYYLAFDYQADKTSSTGTKIACDGYYSNWIIKISPACYSEEAPAAKRVMCEDLGNTLDFDFNDVVFDVSFQQRGGKTEAIINLLAAGGTMPIYVGKDPNDSNNSVFEAHKMLGSVSSTPVNVGPRGKSHAIATYRFEVSESSPNAGNIGIWVKNGNEIKKIGGLRGNLSNYKKDETNNAPQRFATNTNVQWMDECEFIEDGYPSFPDWVQNETENEEWYLNIGDKSKIHEYKAVSSGNGGSDEPSGTSIEVNKKNYPSSSFYYFSLESIGDKNSGKNYLVTLTIKGADIFNKGKIQRCNFGEYDIDRDNNNDSSIESRVQNDPSKGIFEFEVPSTFLNSNYQYVYFADGINAGTIDENTTITCSVKELN